jgi:hypothetical protein
MEGQLGAETLLGVSIRVALTIYVFTAPRTSLLI